MEDFKVRYGTRLGKRVLHERKLGAKEFDV